MVYLIIPVIFNVSFDNLVRLEQILPILYYKYYIRIDNNNLLYFERFLETITYSIFHPCLKSFSVLCYFK